MTLADPELLDPTIHCFARCYWCKSLVRLRENEEGLIFEARKCEKCGIELSETRLIESFAQNFLHTAAITSANKFISFDLAVIPFMAVSIMLTYLEFPVWIRILNLVFYHMPIVLAIRWFKRYWIDIRFDDDEYLDAASRMKRLLVLWCSANLINWGFIAAQWIL